jgi:hypothetical protein
MALQLVRFLGLLLVALALAPALAHALELPNKIRLPREQYLTVQQLYRGWNRLGFIVIGALLSTLALALMARGDGEFVWALAAFGCIALTQVVFWTFTFPVNRRTVNWTRLPENWTSLRLRWEYSHAASAALNLLALASLIASVLSAVPSIERAFPS